MGGAQIFAYNLIKSLTTLGHDVSLYLPNRAKQRYKNLNNTSSICVKSLFVRENFLANNFRIVISQRLKLAQLNNKYDLWQVIGAYPAGWVAKDLVKIVPVILRSHGDDIQKDPEIQYGIGLNPDIDKNIEMTLSKMTHLVALTKTVKSCYNEYGVLDRKITEIPNGVELSRFHQKVKKEQLRDKFGLKKTEKFILTVGRYHLKKGYEILPEVCSLLNKKNIE